MVSKAATAAAAVAGTLVLRPGSVLVLLMANRLSGCGGLVESWKRVQGLVYRSTGYKWCWVPFDAAYLVLLHHVTLSCILGWELLSTPNAGVAAPPATICWFVILNPAGW